jgi:hypothetical protein
MYGLIPLFKFLGLCILWAVTLGWVRPACWARSDYASAGIRRDHASVDRVYIDRRWDGTIILHSDLAALLGIVIVPVIVLAIVFFGWIFRSVHQFYFLSL